MRVKKVDTKIGANIKRERLAKRYKRHHAAEMLDVTGNQIYLYESGKNTISLAKANRLAKKMGVELTKFMRGVKDDDYTS